ncbi:MAG: ATP-binding cassette domain-containing protein, partial [Bdellovibrio sp.]
GFDQASSGQVQVSDFSLNLISASQLVRFRRRVGVVFQEFRLLHDMSVFDNVALPLLFRGENERNIRKKVQDILEQVGLSQALHESPLHLSGGEQQRVAIARAIIHQPELLVADEPTGNLDPELSEEIMDLFERVCAQGTTVLIATHDHALVQRRGKRVLHMQRGQLLEPQAMQAQASDTFLETRATKFSQTPQSVFEPRPMQKYASTPAKEVR